MNSFGKKLISTKSSSDGCQDSCGREHETSTLHNAHKINRSDFSKMITKREFRYKGSDT